MSKASFENCWVNSASISVGRAGTGFAIVVASTVVKDGNGGSIFFVITEGLGNAPSLRARSSV
jgi:hypothetical protein